MRMPAWIARRIHRWASTPEDEEWMWYHWLMAVPIVLILFGASIWVIFVTVQSDAQEKLHARLIERYQSVNGTILSFQLTDRGGDEFDTTYMPIVLYTYIVDGIEYTSSRISPRRFRVHENSRFTRNRQAGKIVRVYYDPNNPSESLLTKEIPTNGLNGLIVGIPGVFMTSLAIFGLLIKIASKLCDDPDA